MSDLRTLHDAFAELERRADATAARTAPVVRPRRAVRLVPVAATVVAVAGMVAGAVWLVPGDPGTHAAGPPTTSSTAPPTTTTRSSVPNSPDALIARFRVVLGDTATFEATDQPILSTVAAIPPAGSSVTLSPPSPTVAETSTTHAFISGTLTSAGVTGSFALMVRSSDSEPGERCSFLRPEDSEDVSTLANGSWLTTGTVQRSPGAVSHMACLKRPDKTMILMFVSNQEDPLGAVIGSPGGDFHAPQPPLTLDQMKAIVTSDKW
jgi:hypothetical protein